MQSCLLLRNKILPFPHTFNNEFLTLSSPINISYVICRALVSPIKHPTTVERTKSSLKMTCRVIALGDKDAVVDATIHRLIERYRRPKELLFNLAEPFEARLKLEVVVAVTFGNRRDYGNIVAFGADIVRRRYHSNINVYRNQRSRYEEGVLLLPFFRPTWDCGMMSCSESLLSVLGIG